MPRDSARASCASTTKWTWFVCTEKWSTRKSVRDFVAAAMASFIAVNSACSRKEGSPPRARSVTWTGWRARWTGRARWGTTGRGPGFRPAPARAPPRRRAGRKRLSWSATFTTLIRAAFSSDEFIDHVLTQLTNGREPTNRFERVVRLAQGAWYKIESSGLAGMAEWECAGLCDMDELDRALRDIGASRAADVIRAIVTKLRAVDPEVKAALPGNEYCDCAGDTVEVPFDADAEIFRPLVRWVIRHRREIAALVN